MNADDQKFLRLAIEVARRARQHGNHPFGAVLVDDQGQVLLEAENTVVTSQDCTGHAETNLIRQASAQILPEVLARASLYTSTEPCAMCSGAIFWGNVRRVVYGLSEAGLSELAGEAPGTGQLNLPCREVFQHGGHPVEVVGPLLEVEAREVHEGFWK